jgi:glycosyltransferase involved in cell wall biosynthesis
VRVLLFTDTIGDLNGVSRFLQDMAENALQNGHELEVITSTGKYCPAAENIHNFPPRFRVRMPFYKELDLAFPPAGLIKEFVRKNPPDLIHVSTPGPVGILGRKIARKMGIRVLGTYHTDFPAYIRDNTGSETLKRATDRWMKKFYDPFVHVFSRSEVYGRIMQEEIGIPDNKISYIRPGTNLKRFNKQHAAPHLWSRHGFRSDSVKVLYVGRVSKEKNVPFLLDTWKVFKTRFPQCNAELALVGEGHCSSKAAQLKSLGVRHLGPIIGEELSGLYASADLFLFPSVTDTLGQVVMESAASSLPVIVSTVGGPKSLLSQHGQSGYALDTADGELWVEKIKELVDQEIVRRSMGETGEAHMHAFPIENSYEDFWSVHVYHFNKKTVTEL